jgi:hypothetical protein
VVTLPVVSASAQRAVAATPLAAGLPGSQKKPGCVDQRRFTFKIHQPHGGGRVVKVEAFVNGKRVLRKKGHKITRITIKKLPKKTFRVRIVATTNKGSKTISVRTYRGCKKSRPHTHVVPPKHR